MYTQMENKMMSRIEHEIFTIISVAFVAIAFVIVVAGSIIRNFL